MADPGSRERRRGSVGRACRLRLPAGAAPSYGGTADRYRPSTGAANRAGSGALRRCAYARAVPAVRMCDWPDRAPGAGCRALRVRCFWQRSARLPNPMRPARRPSWLRRSPVRAANTSRWPTSCTSGRWSRPPGDRGSAGAAGQRRVRRAAAAGRHRPRPGGRTGGGAGRRDNRQSGRALVAARLRPAARTAARRGAHLRDGHPLRTARMSVAHVLRYE